MLLGELPGHLKSDEALNSYRQLALHALAERLRSAGEDDRAAEVRAQASSLRPKIAAARDADSAAAATTRPR